MATDEQKLSDDRTATDPTSAEGCADSMAAVLGSAGAGGMSGIADAMMAKCRRMFERACGEPVAPADTNEPPTATKVADSSTKEA